MQYLLVSLKSSSSCLHPLLRLPVRSIIPPKTYLRKQFLWKMLLTQLAFLHCMLWRMIFYFFTLWNTSWIFIRSFQLIFSILLEHHTSEFQSMPDLYLEEKHQGWNYIFKWQNFKYREISNSFKKRHNLNLSKFVPNGTRRDVLRDHFELRPVFFLSVTNSSNSLRVILVFPLLQKTPTLCIHKSPPLSILEHTNTASSRLSVRPSVRPHRTTRFPLDGFSWNLIYEDSSKICRENSSFIKMWPKYFTWRPT